MDRAKIEEEWLVGNAVVAFVGALLMARAWESMDDGARLPFVPLTSLTLSQVTVLAIVAYLSMASFAFAAASVVAPLKSWAFNHAAFVSPFLEWMMWFAFLVSLGSAVSELPFDEQWARILWFGGIALFLSLAFRKILKPLLSSALALVQLLCALVTGRWKRFTASKRPGG